MNKNNNLNFSELEFTAIIHTLQGKSDEALLSEDEIMRKPYVKGFHFARNKAVYALNPNKYNFPITNLVDFKNVMDCILSELAITDYEITRLDVAINSQVKFDKLYKINNYVKELYATYLNEDNSYFTTGADLKKRSLKVTNRDLELEIYDKEKESKGTDPAKTRIEFRFKRLHKGQTPDMVLNSICKVLDILPQYIDELNKKKINELYAEYLKEQCQDFEGRITSLPVFVSKYADFIYNMNIMSGLYGKCYRGKCKNWLYRYRTSGKTLTLYTKGDLISYLKLIKIAVKNYEKGTSFKSLFDIKNS